MLPPLALYVVGALNRTCHTQFRRRSGINIIHGSREVTSTLTNSVQLRRVTRRPTYLRSNLNVVGHYVWNGKVLFFGQSAVTNIYRPPRYAYLIY